MLYLFLWIAWIMLVFRIVSDISRSDDLGGVGKAGWMLLILVIPWLGALIYLIARGTRMCSRDATRRRPGPAVTPWQSGTVAQCRRRVEPGRPAVEAGRAAPGR
ncbi:MAG: PLD nuclease N-terminal domain-containing protein [Terracoccus sp.]